MNPYCRGPMAEWVTHTMRCGGSLDSFHREMLDSFIPGRLREQLHQKHFYRVHSNGESLANFVRSIQDSARILRLGLTELEGIQVILEGETPQ